MHRKAATRLNVDQPKPPIDTRQLSLDFNHA
jgi:hypothetical protein